MSLIPRHNALQTLSYVVCAAPLPEDRLATVQMDHRLRIWDLATCEVVHTVDVSDHQPTKLVALSDGGLATTGTDRTLKLWSPTAVCQATLGLGGQSSALLALPQNRVACAVITPDVYGLIKVYDATTRVRTATLEGHTCTIRALLLLPDGRLVSGGLDEKVCVWDLVTHARVGVSNTNVGGIRSMALVSDTQLACGKGNGDVAVFDLAAFGGDDPTVPIRTFSAHHDNIDKLVVLSDGRLVTHCEEETVRVWSVATGEELAALPGIPPPGTPMVAAADGTLLTASNHGVLKAWNMDLYACSDSKKATIADDPEANVAVYQMYKVAGHHVITITDDNVIRVWSVGASG
jgi:WD40 repeat protein